MKYPYSLSKLPYAYDALEPYVDARTMETHHTKHHQAYIDKLNAALEKYPDLQAKELEELLRNLETVPEEIRIAVRNHGGGHLNHSLFWEIMAPADAKVSSDAKALADRSADKKTTAGERGPGGDLLEVINSTFGDLSKFKEQFSEAAKTIFGSGWAWLALSEVEGLVVLKLPNQDSPLSNGATPILGLDVWEHAYYLKYQNRRPEYVEAWWNVVNWKEAEKKYETLNPT